jgi:uncharacterized protein (TIGR03437 family)
VTLARAQTSAQLSVGSPSTQPDGTVVVPIQLASSGLQLVGAQFDISLDYSVVSVAVAIGSSASSVAKNVNSAGVPGPAVRVVLVGMNQDTIPDGNVVSLFVIPATTGFSGTVNVFNAVASDASGSNVSISGTSTGGTGGPTLAVVNGASFESGKVAPGEFVSLFQTGMLPAAAGASDLSVTFNRTAAPVLFAGTDQINAVAPFELAESSSAAIAVTYQGQTVAQGAVPMAAVAPAIFSANGSGTGQAFAFNVDGTVNSASNPAARGSTISFFGTGGGVFNPPLIDGQILPSNLTPTSKLSATSSVAIGGKDAALQCASCYVGPAAGFMAGLLQINFLIPLSVTPGSAVPLTWSAAGSQSQAGITIAVK